MSSLFKAKCGMILTMLLWASAFVGIRFAVHDYSPGGLALLRYLIASLFLLLSYPLIKHKKTTVWQAKLAAMGLGIFGFSIYNVCINYGELSVNAGMTSFIISSTPIFSVLLARLIYRELLSFYAQLGFIVSIIGVLVIMLGEPTGHFGFNPAMSLILIAAILPSTRCCKKNYYLLLQA